MKDDTFDLGLNDEITPMYFDLDTEVAVDRGLSPKMAKEKAEKLDYLLGERSPGVDVLQYAYENGDASKYERILSDEERAATAEHKKTVLDAYIAEVVKIGGKPDPAMVQAIASDNVGKVDDEIVAEQKFANKAVNTLVDSQMSTNPKSVIEAEKKNPNVIDVTNVAEEFVAKQEIAKRILGEAEKKVEKESWFSWTVDFIASGFAINEFIKMKDILPEAPSDSWLLGGTVRDKVQYLWSLPPSEFKAKLREAYETLAEKNPVLAKAFVEKVLTYSSSDEILDSAFMVSDVVDIGTLAGGVAKAGVKTGLRKIGKEAAKEAAEPGSAVVVKKTTEKTVDEAIQDAVTASLKTAVKKNAKAGVSYDAVLAAAGHTETAAYTKAVKDMLEEFSIGVTKETLERRKNLVNLLEADLPVPGLNPRKYVEDLDVSHLPLADKVKQFFREDVDSIIRAFSEIPRVSRVDASSEVVQKLIEETQRKFSKVYSRLSDSILDAEHIPADLTPDNVHKVEFIIGHKDKRLFKTEKEAKNWASFQYRLKKGSYTIKQKGSSYYISVVKDVPEADDVLRKTPIETENAFNTNPVIAILNRLSSADAALGKGVIKARKTATYSAQQLAESFREVLKYIEDLPKKQFKDFSRFLRENMHALGPDGKPGRYFDHYGDFANAYVKIIGRPPSEKEYLAYLAFRRLMDLDYVVRNLSIRKELARLGVETVNVKVQGEWVEFFGKIVDDIPWSEKEEAWFVVVDRSGEISAFRKNLMDPEMQAAIRDNIKNGRYVAVRLADSASYPFGPWTEGKRVHFAVVHKEKLKTAPLPWKFISYNPGAGHVIYRDNFFTKVPVLRKAGKKGPILYEGDITVASHTTQKEAKIFSERLNELIDLWRNKEKEKVFDLLEDGYIPLRKQQFEDLMEKIGVTSETKAFGVMSGRRTIDELRLTDVIDLDNNPYDLVRNTKVRFMTDRDPIIPKVEVDGTENNPIFKLAKPKIMDPIEALNETLRQDIDMMFTRDAKIRSVEDFFRQYGDLIKNYDPEVGNVMEVFNKPEWDTTHADQRRLVVAKKAWATLKNFWSHPSYVEATRMVAATTWMNKFLDIGGPKAANIFADWLLPFIKDPFERIRSVTYHVTIGMLNYMQTPQQIMGVVNVAAQVDERIGLRAMGDIFPILSRMYSDHQIDKKVLRDLAEKRYKAEVAVAKTSDLTIEDYMEMIESAYKSGFLVTKHEYIDVSDTNIAPILRRQRNKIAEGMLVFFRFGERVTKASAFAAAFREWKLANNGKKLTEEGLRWIVDRADYLAGSMSKASRNLPQEGLISVMTQFMTYSFHISEQFWTALKNKPQLFVKMFGIYSLVFGVPAATTAFTLVPTQSIWRNFLLRYDAENGTNYADYYEHPLIGLFSQGMLGQAVTMMTGKTTDISRVFGPIGLLPVEYALDVLLHEGDPQSVKQFVLSLLGAGPRKVAQMLESASPFWRYMISFANGEGLELTPADFLGVANNISSVRNISKAAILAAMQKHIFNKEFIQSDTPKIDAVLAAFGITPQEVNDHFSRKKIMRAIDASNRAVAEDIEQQIMWAAISFANGDDETARKHIKNAYVLAEISGMNPIRRNEILANAIVKAYNKYPEVKAKFYYKAVRNMKEKN